MKKSGYLVLCATLIGIIFFSLLWKGRAVKTTRPNTPLTETETRNHAPPLEADTVFSSDDLAQVDKAIAEHGYGAVSKQKRDELRKSYLTARDGADAKLTVHVTDSVGQDVPDAPIRIGFNVNPENRTQREGKTDANGIFVAEGKTSYEVGCAVEKNGYYRTFILHHFHLQHGNDVINGRWQPWNPTLEIKLKEKRNPIPMYARGLSIMLPKKGEAFGFDFKVGDLVAPYGKGENTDVLLKCWGNKPPPPLYSSTHSRYAVLSSDKEGAGFIRKSQDAQSVFKSLHEAPMEGYQSEINLGYRRANNEILEERDFPESEYVIFRSRVEKSEDGEILKSNYGKIYNISFDISANDHDGARVSLLYYFNPTPNDRNLEYDPNENLFDKKKFRGMQP